MFVAMNRFRVAPGAETAFEAMWRMRDRHLDAVPGFLSFHLLKGPAKGDHVLYCSHSQWKDRASFEAWMKSEAFRSAHRDVGPGKTMYLSAPEFEGFETVEGA
jgi:heme-degrading monooxygenase HmoA